MQRSFIILFFFVTGLCFGQGFSIVPIQTKSLEADQFIGVDNFGYTYSITDRTLYKEGNNNHYQFAALSLGDITNVDIINPLKITVFYSNSNTVVILDNTLTEIVRIDFNTIEDFRNVSFATTATDRRLWIFNTDLQQLELFDYNIQKVIVTFQPLEELATTQASNFNFCYVISGDQLYTYNIYGSLLDNQPINNFELLVQHNDNVLGATSNALLYKPNTATSFNTIYEFKNDIKGLYLIDEILYIYNGRELITAQLKPSKK